MSRSTRHSGLSSVEHDYIAPGTEISGFEYHLPVDEQTCRSQIAESLRRGILDVVPRRRLTVIANGPTARNADLNALQTPTLALNGALSLFLEQGLAPTYWACCDPQALVADILPDNLPYETTYFVASKCHSSVFEKLKNHTVRLWHIRDHPAEGRSRIALASSVTISASWLMHRLGYTDFEYWGWDGCFLDGAHHASHAADWSTVPVLHMNYGGMVQDGEVIGGQTFATTRTWAAEAKGAEQFFQLADYFDISIKIHGGGMFERARQAIMDAAA